MKTCLLLTLVVPVLAFSGPASACQSAGYSVNGEPQCITTSDGPGQPYTDGRSSVSGWQWYRMHRLHRRF
jgi:hypothetical protein